MPLVKLLFMNLQRMEIHPALVVAVPMMAVLANLVLVFTLVAWRCDFQILIGLAVAWIFAAPTWLWLATKQDLPFWAGFFCWLFTPLCAVAGIAGNIAVYYSVLAAA